MEGKKEPKRTMAAGEPSSQSEEQCPQLSTTVSSPVLDEDIPGLSGYQGEKRCERMAGRRKGKKGGGSLDDRD